MGNGLTNDEPNHDRLDRFNQLQETEKVRAQTGRGSLHRGEPVSEAFLALLSSQVLASRLQSDPAPARKPSPNTLSSAGALRYKGTQPSCFAPMGAADTASDEYGSQRKGVVLSVPFCSSC